VLLIAIGVFALAYAGAVVVWRDPVTDLYARWKQHQLAASLEDAFAADGATFGSWQAALEIPDKGLADFPGQKERLEAARLAVAASANALHRRLQLGQALGRIEIRRIDLNAVFVQGTRWGPDLSRGPGHYAQTSLPGVGRTMAIAGHRTTFGAPFRHIDSIRKGDWIKLSLPYATFHYRTFAHRIVDNEDWSIVRDRGFDTLVLSACHPLYSAERRWIVFARLQWVEPVGGRPYALTKGGDLRALQA
jgi:sortase A